LTPRLSSAASGQAPPTRIEVQGQAAESSAGQPRRPLEGPPLREIVDPCLGTRWQFVADVQHPERPGRLILIDPRARPMRAAAQPAPNELRNPDANSYRAAAQSRLIRAGDRVTVLQETAFLRARLQAVALESAVAGQTMRVRLLGGADIHTGNQGAVLVVRASSAQEVTWIAVEENRQ